MYCAAKPALPRTQASQIGLVSGELGRRFSPSAAFTRLVKCAGTALALDVLECAHRRDVTRRLSVERSRCCAAKTPKTDGAKVA